MLRQEWWWAVKLSRWGSIELLIGWLHHLFSDSENFSSSTNYLASNLQALIPIEINSFLLRPRAFEIAHQFLLFTPFYTTGCNHCLLTGRAKKKLKIGTFFSIPFLYRIEAEQEREQHYHASLDTAISSLLKNNKCCDWVLIYMTGWQFLWHISLSAGERSLDSTFSRLVVKVFRLISKRVLHNLRLSFVPQ